MPHMFVCVCVRKGGVTVLRAENAPEGTTYQFLCLVVSSPNLNRMKSRLHDKGVQFIKKSLIFCSILCLYKVEVTK